MAEVVIPALISGIATVVASDRASEAQERATNRALNRIYVPRYLGTIDAAIANLILQQKELIPDYDIYRTYVNQILANTQIPQYQYAPYLNAYLSEAFTPQATNQLYQYYLDKLIQDVRGGLSTRGLATSPYGARIENEAIANFANQWAMKDWERQSQALQNYLAGLSGMNQLTGGALSTALQLEELQSGRYQPIISSGLQYMGQGYSPSVSQASILASQIPSAGQGWAQLAHMIPSFIGSLWAQRQSQSPAPIINITSSGELQPTYSDFISQLGRNW